MTTRDMFALVRRRWYIAVVGVSLTLLGAYSAWSAPGLYWAKSTVVLLGPVAPETPNSLEHQADATGGASLLVLRLNGGPIGIRPASPTAELFGFGVRDGATVTVRNIGGQWAPQISAPNIDIDVVGPSPKAVVSRYEDIVRRLRSSLAALQRELQISPSAGLHLDVAPGDLAVQSALPSRSRAAAMSLVIGLALSMVLTNLGDRALQKRRTRMPGRHGASFVGRT